MGVRAYIGRVLIAVDQLFNTVVGGEPDETYSSRAGRQRARGATTGEVACAVLDAIDPDHCATSIEEVDAPHHMGKVIREIPRGSVPSEPGDPAVCMHRFEPPWMNCVLCGVEAPPPPPR